MRAAILSIVWAAVSFAVAYPTGESLCSRSLLSFLPPLGSKLMPAPPIVIVPDTIGSRLSSNPDLPRFAPPGKGLHSSEGPLHELAGDERARYANQAVVLQRGAWGI
jgi:hypothetical protein